MTYMTWRKTTVVLALGAALVVAGCSTERAIDNTVGVAAGATKVVAKGAVGAGRLVVKGGKKVAGVDN